MKHPEDFSEIYKLVLKNKDKQLMKSLYHKHIVLFYFLE